MKKIYQYSLALLAVALTFVACSDDDDNYQWDSVSGQQVYFSNVMKTAFEISPSATSFEVPIYRVNDTEAVSVPLSITLPEGTIYSAPSSISFAAGQKVANIPFTYDPANIVYGNYEKIAIQIGDETYTTKYGNSSVNITAGVTDWGDWGKWNAAGTCTYMYNLYWSGDDPGLSFTARHNFITPNLYQFKVTGCYYNVELVLDYDEATGRVSAQPTNTGYHNTNYDEDVLVADYNYYFETVRGKTPGVDFEPVYGTFDKEQGIIEIPLVFYISLGYFGAGYEQIYIDGYSRADASCEIAYGGKLIDPSNTPFIVGNVTLGADVETANVALVPGELTQEAYDAIVAGTYENVQEITQSGDVKFDATDLADGKYTLVVVTFIGGEAKEYAEASFKYVAASADETWTPAFIGTYVYGAKSYTSDGSLFYDQVYTDEGLTLFQSDRTPNRYRIAPLWASEYGMDFLLNDEDGTIVVEEVETGHDSKYGMIYVTDIKTYGTADLPSYYENGVFYFNLAYHVPEGVFAYVQDTFTLTAKAAASKKASKRAAKGNKAIKERARLMKVCDKATLR